VVGVAGPRIFLFRRDAINLAKLHRAGELTSVWVLDKAHEAIRDLVRARQAAVRTLRQARQQLSGFLLRQGHHYKCPVDAHASAVAGRPALQQYRLDCFARKALALGPWADVTG
jgi:transposase